MLRRMATDSKFIDPVKWRNKKEILNCIDKIGIRSFSMIERVFREYLAEIDQNKSGGFTKLAMIIGNDALSPKKDVDRLWNRLVDCYGNGEIEIIAIKRTLGSLLMIMFAEDKRYWVWEPDPDKQIKLANDEKPEGNIYYKDPKKYIQYNAEDLFKKFNMNKRK